MSAETSTRGREEKNLRRSLDEGGRPTAATATPAAPHRGVPACQRVNYAVAKVIDVPLQLGREAVAEAGLEGPQCVHPLLQRAALVLQGAEQLVPPAGHLDVQLVGAPLRVRRHPVRVRVGLRLQPGLVVVRLADDAVGVRPRLAHQAVGLLGGELQQPGDGGRGVRRRADLDAVDPRLPGRLPARLLELGLQVLDLGTLPLDLRVLVGQLRLHVVAVGRRRRGLRLAGPLLAGVVVAHGLVADGGELLLQRVVLLGQLHQRLLDLVDEVVDVGGLVAGAAGQVELAVPHLIDGQGHLFTSCE